MKPSYIIHDVEPNLPRKKPFKIPRPDFIDLQLLELHIEVSDLDEARFSSDEFAETIILPAACLLVFFVLMLVLALVFT